MRVCLRAYLLRYVALLHRCCIVVASLLHRLRSGAVVARWVELKTALSLLDFACDGADDLRCVVRECDVLDACKLVLIVRDLVFHSLDFEDVPLVTVTDVDLVVGALECGAHWVHCEFERFLLERVAIFEFTDDTIAGCDA